MAAQDPATEVAIQTELIPVELPDYHGRKPSGMKTRVSGYWTRVGRLHAIDDTVVAVVELKMKSEGHGREGDQILYLEGMVLVDGFEVPGKAGTRLLSSLRATYKTTDDAAKGKTPLAMGDVDLGTDGEAVTDGSGVVLTREELAEIRSDPLRAVVDDRVGPAVVVFSDGMRQLWPDEFDQGDPRPAAGDRYEDEKAPSGYVYVERLLDATTGETVAEWTAEQETARLVELEGNAAELELAAEALASTPAETAYFRIEHHDGSVAELDAGEVPDPELVRDAMRFVAVAEDGSETVLKDRSLKDMTAEEKIAAVAVPAEVLAEVLGTGTEADGDYHAEGCALADDHPGDCEDAEGFALIVAPPAPEPTLPLPEDFTFVDRQIAELADDLAGIDDLARLARLVKAEEQGRGRDLKPRKGVFELLERRRIEISS